MPIPRLTQPIAGSHLLVQVTDDHSRTLIDPVRQVAYHSASGAIAETRHVYLENSGVRGRLQAGAATRVLEIGLGTGMGLLLTLDAALAARAALTYTALEQDWLAAGVLRPLQLEQGLADGELADEFLRWRESLGPSAASGLHRWQAGPRQQVIVHHQDALQWQAADGECFDAIYFDPFAPQADAELWHPPFLARLRNWLSDDGRLVTYCVSRVIREAFTSVGFHVTRVPGPPAGKREVMIAYPRKPVRPVG
jgi:tRNA U34 5-methylaminomethyl-2-thiouridine-forming methyltransferase MnmC